MNKYVKLARKGRKECNKHTLKERTADVEFAMKIINNGWKSYLAKLESGDPLTVLVETNLLRSNGYLFVDYANGSMHIRLADNRDEAEIVNGEPEPKWKIFTNSKQLCKWLVKEAKKIRNL